MVELHGSHGYLLDNFYSKQMNLRTDEYGGSFENRIRIFVETLRKIRERIGSEFPVSVRITADDMMGDSGNTLEDGVRLANALVDAGAQIINVSGGGPLSIGTPDMPEAAFAHWAAAIKSSLGDRAFVSVANRIKRPEVAEYVLASGQSDLVTMGRALICDPELLTKAREGRKRKFVCAPAATIVSQPWLPATVPLVFRIPVWDMSWSMISACLLRKRKR